MLRHPYILVTALLVVLSAYVARHPELWLERAHEEELRAACEAIEKTMAVSTMEYEHFEWYRKQGKRELVKTNVISMRNGKYGKTHRENTHMKKLQISDGVNEYIHWNYPHDADEGWYVDYPYPRSHAAPIPWFKGTESTPYSYEIMQELVNVDGHACIEVRLYRRGHHDKWFLDPDIGYMPRKTIHQCHGEGSDEAPHGPEIDYADYREITEGVYFPFSYKDRAENPVTILSINLSPAYSEDEFQFPDKAKEQMADSDWTFYVVRSTYSRATRWVAGNL